MIAPCRPLAFQQACLAPIFAIASLLVLSPGVTLGCQLQGVCMLLSSALYGPALAGALVCLQSSHLQIHAIIQLRYIGVQLTRPKRHHIDRKASIEHMQITPQSF